MPKVTKKKSEELVQASLGHRISKHEAICAERWKTIFNKIEAMEKGASDRFNGIEEQVSRIETILLGSAGFLIVTLASIVIGMITIH